MQRGRLILRYTLLQLPGYAVLGLLYILVKEIVDLPAYSAWTVFGLWVAKDIVLFPFVGRYYDPGYNRGRFSMIGRQGVVDKPLTPTGTVRIRGELWKAEVLDPGHAVDTGRTVTVQEIRGLTLQVTVENNSNP